MPGSQEKANQRGKTLSENVDGKPNLLKILVEGFENTFSKHDELEVYYNKKKDLHVLYNREEDIVYKDIPEEMKL